MTGRRKKGQTDGDVTREDAIQFIKAAKCMYDEQTMRMMEMLYTKYPDLPKRILTPDDDKQEKCVSALRMMEEKEVRNPYYLVRKNEPYMVNAAGARFDDAAYSVGLDPEEAYSLFIFQNSQSLKNAISDRKRHAEYAKKKRINEDGGTTE